MNLCPEYTLFKDQMTLHAISNFNRDESYTYIAPNSGWTLEDYKGLHYYIRAGFLCVWDCDLANAWCVNPGWSEERPMWDIGMEIQTE